MAARMSRKNRDYEGKDHFGGSCPIQRQNKISDILRTRVSLTQSRSRAFIRQH